MMPSSKKSKRENKRAKENANPLGEDTAALPRALQSVRLRRLGYTYQEIAEKVGYRNESSARTAVKNANKNILRDDTRALVGWQLDRIDMALTLVMRRIQRDDEYSLFAVDRLVPLLKRQSELMSLDAPKDTPQSAQMTVIPIAADVLEVV